MKLNRRIKIIIIVCFLIYLPLIAYKLQDSDIYWLRFDNQPDGAGFFIVINPPSSKKDLVKLIENFNKSISLDAMVVDEEKYTQFFYKESFNITRFHEPHYSIQGDLIDIRESDFFCRKEYLLTCHYLDKRKEEDCNNECPIYPYYSFPGETDSITYEYYPKGLKENTNIHWKKIVK